MTFEYKDDTHIYQLDGVAIPSLTGMLAADGLADDLKFVKPEVLEAKRDWGTRLHLALQKVEYGFGVDPEFKQHCVDWLDICRRLKWMRDGVPIWKNCELPALARYEGFVFGFTPDRAHPDAIVEIKGTYSPTASRLRSKSSAWSTRGIRRALWSISTVRASRKSPRASRQ
jgi:hypothetical protein